MKSIAKNFFLSLHWGARLILIIFVAGFPLAWAGHQLGWVNLYDWVPLVPARVWRGEVWRVFTYAFLSAGPIDWLVGVFWLATLVSILSRDWNGKQLWGYCCLGAVAGAVPMISFQPSMEAGVVGNGAVLFALLIAWDWLHRNERLLLLGIGEISVRQAVIFIGVLTSLVLLICPGWLFMLCAWCGGIAGGAWLLLRFRRSLGRAHRPAQSERVARLEL